MSSNLYFSQKQGHSDEQYQSAEQEDILRKINQALLESGEKARLKASLRARLEQFGWTEKLMNVAEGSGPFSPSPIPYRWDISAPLRTQYALFHFIYYTKLGNG